MQFKIKVDNSHGMESTNLQNVRNAKEEKRAEQREREGWRDLGRENQSEERIKKRTSMAQKQQEKKPTNKQHKIATVHFVYCLVCNLIQCISMG